ncbi:hypothetical protein G6F37_009569 [Rhizopus arrhizus]|nr:hypothetical protein G6F38_010393 [Rhizopus arrhizus]KAG1154309.1 hypothetical protein G6F37_009569 [Rhizopus arrhizus]
MSHYQITDFNEPYSSVSFQFKQPTSPYPTYRNHIVYKPTTTLQISRWLRLHRKSILLFTCFILFVLYCARYWIVIYWNFLAIKLRNTLFDRGYVSCGVLRKQPVLYVQDTNHVQVVWETNCGTDDKPMMLSYWSDSKENQTILGPIEPHILDNTHTVYKATIGPVENSKIHYSIYLSEENDRSLHRKTWTENTFGWHLNSDRSIRIAALADNQFGMLTFLTLLQQIKRIQPDYLLHAGDAVQNYPSLRQWQTDFTDPLTVFGLGQTKPMVYAHGNHDFDTSSVYSYTRSGEHPWFSFTMAAGAIHFIVLDSNLDWEIQDDWLRQETTTEAFKRAQFRIVVVHVPPFLEYWDPEAWFGLKQSEWSAFIKERYVPLFEASGVDLVISGHQHNYERGERNGIQYAIIGGAGGDLDFDQVKDWGMYEAKLFDFHFVLLEFNPPASQDQSWTLKWDTYNINGEKVDTTRIESRIKDKEYL